MIHVFVGPSYPDLHTTAVPFYEHVAVYPPARRNDLVNLKSDPADTVVIIDGVMIYSFPPSPKEVYDLLQRGQHVIGTSSLGAIRAVELKKFGMKGHGGVYRHICSEFAFRDDELVCMYDQNFKYLTVPMINVRFHLEHFRSNGAISDQDLLETATLLSSVHFSARKIELVREVFVCRGIPLAREGANSMGGIIDVKRQDASDLLCDLGIVCN
jgi:hypothetical protein